MVEHKSPDSRIDLDAVFGAIADPTRRSMLMSLASQPRSIGELAAPFDITLAAASKHVKVLERAGLIQREVRGRTHRCRIEAAPLHAGLEWIRHYERFWNEKLDALEALLIAENAAQKAAEKTKPSRKRSSR